MTAVEMIERASVCGWEWEIYGHISHNYEVYISWKPWYDEDQIGPQQFGGDNESFDGAVRFAYEKAAKVDERLREKK